MKRATLLFVALTLIAAATTPAFAEFRPVQAPISGTGLAGFMLTHDPGIMVGLEQDNTQGWGAPLIGNAVATLMIELTGNAANNALGVYNAGSPSPTSRFEILPSNAGDDWFAVASFHAPSTMKVNLYDNNGNPVGLQATYTGVSINNFGYYIQNKAAADDFGYTEDAQNSGNVRALAFRGEGNNTGSWWVCFEDGTSGPDNDYDDAILFVQAVQPTPVTKATWASVKARFR